MLAQLEDIDTLDAGERRELLAAILVAVANLVAQEDGDLSTEPKPSLCTRCGKPLRGPFRVPTDDGERHEVCPDDTWDLEKLRDAPEPAPWVKDLFGTMIKRARQARKAPR